MLVHPAAFHRAIVDEMLRAVGGEVLVKQRGERAESIGALEQRSNARKVGRFGEPQRGVKGANDVVSGQRELVERHGDAGLDGEHGVVLLIGCERKDQGRLAGVRRLDEGVEAAMVQDNPQFWVMQNCTLRDPVR